MIFFGNFWLLLLLLPPALQCLKPGYVVDTDYCRIPDPNPYNAQLMRNFRRGTYKACTNLQPLTWVEYNESSQRYVLSVNESSYRWYLETDLELRVPAPAALSCCYMDVLRPNEKHVELGACRDFENSVQLPSDTDSFIVECRAKGKLIYTNAHATVPERRELRKRLQQWRAKSAPSVLLIGIDSISRLNLIRAMPKTYRYLNTHSWFELSGYNKVADNTLPNVLALLTGRNMSSILNECDPHEVGGLDRCNFIWQLYRDLGYVTAFGEDDVAINTFNFNLQGFQQPPVDYYLRPYMIAAEQWLDQEDREDQLCLGYDHASEHIYNYALEFARRYRNDSFFGVFWTNTHSHGARIARTTTMDEYMVRYLKSLRKQGTMEHTIVVLLSDHGQRQGPTRLMPLGWLEERLPFLFLWLPPKLRLEHPEFVQALRQNNQRLTNPYDLHATLQHVLALSGRNSSIGLRGTGDCSNCQSLLLPIAANRSCAPVGIPDHWCTCWSYQEHNQTSALLEKVAHFGFRHISDLYAKMEQKRQLLHAKPISLAAIYRYFVALPNPSDDPLISIHRVQFLTQPGSILYEITVRYNASSKQMIASDLSRFA